MVTSHVLKRIKERQIEIDIEMIEYFTHKHNTEDTAVFLGKVMFLGENNNVILIIRDGNAVTVEFRRCGQNCDEKALKVSKIVPYPCLF